MYKIRNEKGEVTTDNAEIQRIIRDYYEQLHDNETDNLEEMTETIIKINKSKSWFFEKINKIDKLLIFSSVQFSSVAQSCPTF